MAPHKPSPGMNSQPGREALRRQRSLPWPPGQRDNGASSSAQGSQRKCRDGTPAGPRRGSFDEVASSAGGIVATIAGPQSTGWMAQPDDAEDVLGLQQQRQQQRRRREQQQEQSPRGSFTATMRESSGRPGSSYSMPQKQRQQRRSSKEENEEEGHHHSTPQHLRELEPRGQQGGSAGEVEDPGSQGGGRQVEDPGSQGGGRQSRRPRRRGPKALDSPSAVLSDRRMSDRPPPSPVDEARDSLQASPSTNRIPSVFSSPDLRLEHQQDYEGINGANEGEDLPDNWLDSAIQHSSPSHPVPSHPLHPDLPLPELRCGSSGPGEPSALFLSGNDGSGAHERRPESGPRERRSSLTEGGTAAAAAAAGVPPVDPWASFSSTGTRGRHRGHRRSLSDIDDSVAGGFLGAWEAAGNAAAALWGDSGAGNAPASEGDGLHGFLSRASDSWGEYSDGSSDSSVDLDAVAVEEETSRWRTLRINISPVEDNRDSGGGDDGGALPISSLSRQAPQEVGGATPSPPGASTATGFPASAGPSSGGGPWKHLRHQRSRTVDMDLEDPHPPGTGPGPAPSSRSNLAHQEGPGRGAGGLSRAGSSSVLSRMGSLSARQWDILARSNTAGNAAPMRSSFCHAAENSNHGSSENNTAGGTPDMQPHEDLHHRQHASALSAPAHSPRQESNSHGGAFHHPHPHHHGGSTPGELVLSYQDGLRLNAMLAALHTGGTRTDVLAAAEIPPDATLSPPSPQPDHVADRKPGADVRSEAHMLLKVLRNNPAQSPEMLRRLIALSERPTGPEAVAKEGGLETVVMVMSSDWANRVVATMCAELLRALLPGGIAMSRRKLLKRLPHLEAGALSGVGGTAVLQGDSPVAEGPAQGGAEASSVTLSKKHLKKLRKRSNAIAWACHALVRMMQRFQAEEAVQDKGSSALWGVLSPRNEPQSMAHREIDSYMQRVAATEVLEAGGVFVLINDLKLHAGHANVAYSAVGALLAIAQLGPQAREAIDRQQGRRAIRSAMTDHPAIGYGGRFASLATWLGMPDSADSANGSSVDPGRLSEGSSCSVASMEQSDQNTAPGEQQQDPTKPAGSLKALKAGLRRLGGASRRAPSVPLGASSLADPTALTDIDSVKHIRMLDDDEPLGGGSFGKQQDGSSRGAEEKLWNRFFSTISGGRRRE